MGLLQTIKQTFSRPSSSSARAADRDDFFVGVSPNAFRDRTDWNFQTVIEDSLHAWRENPLARRIVNLQTQYVIGDGIEIKSEDADLLRFINQWWHHPLNDMDLRAAEWCDELTRTGNLFILVSTDLSGMSYVRAVPATAVKKIETAKNDYEQGLFYEYQEDDELNVVKVYAEDGINATTETRMIHFAVNRPVGAKWGEPDLAPLLVWLSRYSGWLEDRARLNHYRNSFLFTVKTTLRSESERIERQNQLNSRPLTPGSILVTNESEQWDVLSAKLESAEAEADGLAIKKQIAAGAGIPLHFLAEPESQNKASAEAAGGATYRTYEQRQKVFLHFLTQVIRVVCRRRFLVDHAINYESDFELVGADISGKDNSELATAAATMTNVATQLRKLGYISRSEFVRLSYSFGGENVNPETLLAEAADDKFTAAEMLHFYGPAEDDSDARKYNTTTISGEVAHNDQGFEVN